MEKLNNVLWSSDEDDDIIELQGIMVTGCTLQEGCEDTGKLYITKCYYPLNSPSACPA